MSPRDLGTVKVKLRGDEIKVHCVPDARLDRLTDGTGHFEVVSSRNAFCCCQVDYRPAGDFPGEIYPALLPSHRCSPAGRCLLILSYRRVPDTTVMTSWLQVPSTSSRLVFLCCPAIVTFQLATSLQTISLLSQFQTFCPGTSNKPSS